jgi:hypothetical protein
MSEAPPPQYRQGPYLFVAVGELPEGAERTQSDGRIVLPKPGARAGRTTTLTQGAKWQDASGSTYVVVTRATPVIREGHDDLLLPPGVYHVVAQREYAPSPLELRSGPAKGQTFTFWLGTERRQRLDRLKSQGAGIDVSKTCQTAVDTALETAERALGGERLALVAARLKSARTPSETAEAEGIAAGRRWAEDIAAMSELRRVAALLNEIESKRLVITDVALQGGRLHLERVFWGEDGNFEPWPDVALPQSVPRDFFASAREPRNGVRFVSSSALGFLQGAAAVLSEVEVFLTTEVAASSLSKRAGAT